MKTQMQSPPRAAGSSSIGKEAPLYLLDGHSLTFKAYWAVRGLNAPDGRPIGAVFGFLRMLLKLIDELKPRMLAVVFDTGAPTFRSEIYADYKAHREAPPPDFGDQMDCIDRLLSAMKIATFEMDGYEADDLIATMASQRSADGGASVIVSADKDLFQLVDERTQMLRFGARELERFDAGAVEAKLGIRPEQVPDWLALVGDASDNIPGVPSIGEKSATQLLQEHESLEKLIEGAEGIGNARRRESLRANAEQARMSRRLATVARDAPLEWSLEACRLPENIWTDEVVALLSELGFDSILKERGLTPVAALAANDPSEYRLVLEEGELERWIESAREAEWLALDTETTGLDPMRAEIVGLCLSVAPGEAIYAPISHRVGASAERQIPIERVREIVGPLLTLRSREGRGPRLTAHHAKYDWKILERAGFELPAPDFDTMIASFVLDPGRDSGHGLKALASEICGVAMRPISDIIGSGKKALGVDEVTPESIADYAARDADATLRLTRALAERLETEPKLKRLFDEIEMPLEPVLHRMETGGVAVERKQLERLSATMSAEIVKLAGEIEREAGRAINVDSPKQLAQLLFEEMGLPAGRKTKTGYSTDAEVLETLAGEHKIAALILQYRELAKLKSTYADALPREVNPRTGRIHTNFSQTIAATGRLSSMNPNLQNIPVRTAMGREIRRTFVPDGPGCKLLSADYSQIELRILAHFSGDENLRRAYREGRDIHRLTASRVFGALEKDVTAEMRDKAKTINFGIIYGMGARGLALRLGIARADAQKFIDAYFGGYPGVRRWIDATLEGARRDGYVETMMGRRRRLAHINESNRVVRAADERIAVNTPIQGTSADMIKLAMIRIDAELGAIAPSARMILQVHDELIFSIRDEELEAAEGAIRRLMIEALPLEIPIVVDVSVGENWAEC